MRILTKTKQKLRTGYTTGACAAGAAKAAALLLFRGINSDHVGLEGPQGDIINIPIKALSLIEGTARAVVLKDGGDDPDVTHGLEIVAELSSNLGGLSISGGEGVGIVTMPGLPVNVGCPAINPAPLEMIKKALLPIIPENIGVSVIISVPGGREAAKSTLNQRLGICGGISILGTSGIVRPMSQDALKESLEPFIRKAAAMGHDKLILTPGGFGFRQLVEEFGAHPDTVVETSNYIGFMLEKCVENNIEAVILWGQIGKMTKIAGGIFNTHSRVADGRREILAAQAALQGAKKELIEEILNSNTLESALMCLERSGLSRVVDNIAEKASKKAEEYVWGNLRVGTVITGRNGRIIAADGNARELGRFVLCRELK